jgi:isopentenyl phosphate kinase
MSDSAAQSLTFLKLGGSLITDKRAVEHFRADAMAQAAAEIAGALAVQPALRLLIGHGSGSFGHVAAQKHGTVAGVYTPADWRGFAEVALAARRLHTLVLEALSAAGLPVLSVQPSASALCESGRLLEMATAPITTALEHGLIPVVYGDVALDSVRGGTIISTETIFDFLADRLRPARIMLAGEAEGVYDADSALIPRITPRTMDAVAGVLGGSDGTDVTGGMASKVRAMLALAGRITGLEVRIFGGRAPRQLQEALCGTVTPGTVITCIEDDPGR